jgi:hypothetical protein
MTIVVIMWKTDWFIIIIGGAAVRKRNMDVCLPMWMANINQPRMMEHICHSSFLILIYIYNYHFLHHFVSLSSVLNTLSLFQSLLHLFSN